MIEAPQLSTTDWRQLTDDDVWAIAVALKSDFCTGASRFYWRCCVIHDWYYRTGLDFDFKTPVSRAESDQRLRQCQQMRSYFGVISPMAWWRWGVVRVIGWWAYDPQPVTKPG